MKPLGFTLEEARDLLAILDALDAAEVVGTERDALVDRLAMYRAAAQQRCAELRTELETPKRSRPTSRPRSPASGGW